MNIAHLLGALILGISGAAALILPGVLARLIQIDMNGARGKAELRINFGAFWIGLAAAAIYWNEPVGYHILGVGWAVIALVRVAAALINRPRIDTMYGLLFVGEVITAVLLLS